MVCDRRIKQTDRKERKETRDHEAICCNRSNRRSMFDG